MPRSDLQLCAHDIGIDMMSVLGPELQENKALEHAAVFHMAAAALTSASSCR